MSERQMFDQAPDNRAERTQRAKEQLAFVRAAVAVWENPNATSRQKEQIRYADDWLENARYIARELGMTWDELGSSEEEINTLIGKIAEITTHELGK